MKRNLLRPLVVLFLSLLVVACVKDTDFDQAEDIALTPVVELDLIYFDIDAGEFYDEINEIPVLTCLLYTSPSPRDV